MKTKEQHQMDLECATRGSVAEYQDAVLAAVADGHKDLAATSDVCWAERVLGLRTQLQKMKEPAKCWLALKSRSPEDYERALAAVGAGEEGPMSRYKLNTAEFGLVIRDTHRRMDMPLVNVVAMLNECRPHHFISNRCTHCDAIDVPEERLQAVMAERKEVLAKLDLAHAELDDVDVARDTMSVAERIVVLIARTQDQSKALRRAHYALEEAGVEEEGRSLEKRIGILATKHDDGSDKRLAHLQSVVDERNQANGRLQDAHRALNNAGVEEEERALERRINILAIDRNKYRQAERTVVHTIGGLVEGQPTHLINYLQRLRQLVDIEQAHADGPTSLVHRSYHEQVVNELKRERDSYRQEAITLHCTWRGFEFSRSTEAVDKHVEEALARDVLTHREGETSDEWIARADAAKHGSIDTTEDDPGVRADARIEDLEAGVADAQEEAERLRSAIRVHMDARRDGYNNDDALLWQAVSSQSVDDLETEAQAFIDGFEHHTDDLGTAAELIKRLLAR